MKLGSVGVQDFGFAEGLLAKLTSERFFGQNFFVQFLLFGMSTTSVAVEAILIGKKLKKIPNKLK